MTASRASAIAAIENAPSPAHTACGQGPCQAYDSHFKMCCNPCISPSKPCSPSNNCWLGCENFLPCVAVTRTAYELTHELET